jgi:sarcosine oxidase subunit gamma
LIVEKEHRDLKGLIHAAIKQDMAAITDQSHSRCVLRISGPQARNLFRKGTTQDMDGLSFRTDDVRTTSLFHMNAVIHCVAEETIDIYVARSFGHSFYEVLCHAAMEYGYRVVAAL